MEKETFQILEPFLENLSRVRLITHQIIIYIYMSKLLQILVLSKHRMHMLLCAYMYVRR